MNSASFQTVVDQLLADLRQESQLLSLIMKGCIEYRWAIGAEEQEMAKAIVYNAFEAYVIARGVPLEHAEVFCEENLDDLIDIVQRIL
jgi:hypothetical protein